MFFQSSTDFFLIFDMPLKFTYLAFFLSLILVVKSHLIKHFEIYE